MRHELTTEGYAGWWVEWGDPETAEFRAIVEAGQKKQDGEPFADDFFDLLFDLVTAWNFKDRRGNDLPLPHNREAWLRIPFKIVGEVWQAILTTIFPKPDEGPREAV